MEEEIDLIRSLSWHMQHLGSGYPLLGSDSTTTLASISHTIPSQAGPETARCESAQLLPSEGELQHSEVEKCGLTDDRDFLQSWTQLREDALRCTKCRLCAGRTHVVFGDGNYTSPPICFVGEGPGAEEDAQGLPFVGKSGQLLTRAIENGMGLARSQVYICNVVKCRPPDNRAPLPDETATCMPFLERQLELVQPQVIVALGAVALKALIGETKGGITALRGKWLEWRGFKLLPTFHPAYLLRNPPAKKLFWEDLKQVMSMLGLTKQSTAE